MLQNVEIVRTLLTSLDRDADTPWPSADRHEFDRLLRLDLFDADVELRQPARFPVGQEFHGHQGVRQWAAEIWEVFSEVRQELDEVIEAGDGETLVSAVRSCVRMRQTGLEFELRWATVWTIRGGKVQRAHSYATKAKALGAAGLAA